MQIYFQIATSTEALKKEIISLNFFHFFDSSKKFLNVDNCLWHEILYFFT